MPDLASALAAMKRSTGRGRGRKSEIYLWMDERHDALLSAFAKDPPSWTGLAKHFTEAGMLTADGLPQTPASVRSTWMRVAQSRSRMKLLQPPVQPNPSPPPERPSPVPREELQLMAAPQPPAVDKPTEPAADDDPDNRITEPSSKFGGLPATSRFKPKGSPT